MKNKYSDISRRCFLTACGAVALGSGSLYSSLARLQLAQAQMAQVDDYKALVCIFLYGGNDAFNMLVPYSQPAYDSYAATRRALAVVRGDLLELTPKTFSNGVDYGFHPAMAGAHELFASGRLAVIGNIGALVEPVSKAAYQSKSVLLPPQLFSHNDQQNFVQSLQSTTRRNGWAGRAADVLAEVNSHPKLSMNISMSGSNLWQSGNAIIPYAINPGGVDSLAYLKDTGDAREAARTQVYHNLLNQNHSHIFQREFARTQNLAWELADEVGGILASQAPLSTSFPSGSPLAASLKMTARLIKAHSTLGMSRQMFFIGMGDFDTHGDQNTRQPNLFRQLSEGLAAFSAATEELGLQDKITTFTASDFGRTLTSNGDGTDHGWSSHQLVMGGAVSGGDIYGQIPELVIGGNDDIGEGRIIPGISIDQYAATLLRWYGLGESNFADVFPNLANFAASDLGFMM